MRKIACLAVFTAFLFTAGTLAAQDVIQETPPIEETKAEQPTPLVEVVFVLDSTGSMSGLIEGAKQKIWAIANEIILQKPEPDVKMGLLTYRDKGDEYVTKMFDLTDDIDAIYGHLQTIKASGGGDTPESVNQALHEAVHKMAWSPVDKEVYRVVFLVGDAPPHMDYQDDVKYPETCKFAAENGIIINTVQCGGITSCTPIWQEIALKSEGNFVQLSQTGNVIAVESPYDKEIRDLTVKLNDTVIAYGDKKQMEVVSGKLEVVAKSSITANADRAQFNNMRGGVAIQGRGDLLADVEADEKLLEKTDELPAELQRMNVEERKEFLEQKQAERTEINKKLGELTAQRAQWMDTEGKKVRMETAARASATAPRTAAYGSGGAVPMSAEAMVEPGSAPVTAKPSASFDESVTETIRTQFQKVNPK